MIEQNHLAESLRYYKELRKLTMKDFAAQLDIPLSTLRTILKHGNTTLHTAIKISRKLGVSLDILVNDHNLPDKLFFMEQMQRSASWFANLPADKKDAFAGIMTDMWNMIINMEMGGESDD